MYVLNLSTREHWQVYYYTVNVLLSTYVGQDMRLFLKIDIDPTRLSDF